MTQPIVEYAPFDYLVANAAKYQGVEFDFKLSEDGEQVDFALKYKGGETLDKFELYPLLAMFVDTQLRDHPAFEYVDAILADFDKAWNEEYQRRTAESN